jgi:hypothetical protein
MFFFTCNAMQSRYLLIYLVWNVLNVSIMFFAMQFPIIYEEQKERVKEVLLNII